MTVTLEEAAQNLAALVKEAAGGEEIVITHNQQPLARLVAPEKPRARFGSGKGTVWMAPDFDEPLEDFKDYL